MIALITGSTGFIGSHICRVLIENGFQVRAFHRPESPLTLIQELDLEHAVGDMTQPESLVRAMQGVKVVFHAAAQLGRQRGSPEQMYAVTVQGTQNVLNAALHTKVDRVVHTSSVASLGLPRVHGIPAHALEASNLINENHTWNDAPTHWRYSHAKYLAELEVQNAVAAGLDAVIVNPAVVLGAGDINRVSGNVVIQASKGHIPLAAPGGLNVVHIRDVATGHYAALNYGRTGNRYILGRENLPHLAFLQMIAKVCQISPPYLVLPPRFYHILACPVNILNQIAKLPIDGNALKRIGYYFYYDISKAANELEWKPQYSTKQGIQDAYDWYISNGYIKER